MTKTNFDKYLEEQLKDPDFARGFQQAGEAWDVALQIASLRQQAGLSQKELAGILKTSQQQVSRLESPGYEGHSVSSLRRVAAALNATMRITFEPVSEPVQEHSTCVAEGDAEYQGEKQRGRRGGGDGSVSPARRNRG